MEETRQPRPADVLEGIGRLLDATHDLSPDELGPVVAGELERMGAGEGAVYLVDYELVVLVPMNGGEAIPIEGTLAGRAFQNVEAVVSSRADQGWTTTWLPLLDGVERLGVLHVATPRPPDEALVRRLEQFATCVAAMVVSKAKYGDAIELTRRRQEMTLKAELRYAMLPPLSFRGKRASASCWLAPSYSVSGDAVDYASSFGCLHFAVFDPVGHDLVAARLGNLVLAAYRNARRAPLGLPEVYSTIDGIVSTEFGEERFVTGLIASLEVETGCLRWINAGHPRPLILRGTQSTIEMVSESALPFGMGDAPAKPGEAQLEPGDHILCFSDGVVEAETPRGGAFGVERLIDLARRSLLAGHRLSETVRRLGLAVWEHAGGTLKDDATLLVVGWHPPESSVVRPGPEPDAPPPPG